MRGSLDNGRKGGGLGGLLRSQDPDFEFISKVLNIRSFVSRINEIIGFEGPTFFRVSKFDELNVKHLILAELPNNENGTLEVWILNEATVFRNSLLAIS